MTGKFYLYPKFFIQFNVGGGGGGEVFNFFF